MIDCTIHALAHCLTQPSAKVILCQGTTTLAVFEAIIDFIQQLLIRHESNIFLKPNLILSVRNSSKKPLLFSLNISKNPLTPEKTISLCIAWYKKCQFYIIFMSQLKSVKLSYFLNLEIFFLQYLFGLAFCLLIQMSYSLS